MFCKHLLWVRKSTTTNDILLELGRTPLMIFKRKSVVKNWKRIRHGNSNILVSSSMKDTMNLNLNWTEKLKLFMSEIGLLNYFMNFAPFSRIPVNKGVFERIRDISYQEQISSISDENSKHTI